ncbi:MAG TPA: hypothetical protein DDW50_21105 [Firmicutes bacterium]|jgi:hypothetical protein|nr:hypothetical protein [Bacillota bacterium]
MPREKQLTREVMSLPELKKFLRIGTIKALELLESGKVPGKKFGTRWRIYRDDAINYLRSGKPNEG